MFPLDYFVRSIAYKHLPQGSASSNEAIRRRMSSGKVLSQSNPFERELKNFEFEELDKAYLSDERFYDNYDECRLLPG